MVEIDTIDDDDEKESIEVSENMTQYPTNPSSSAKLRVSKTNFLTEKNTPTPPLLPLKLSTFDYFFFFLNFSKLEEKKFFPFKYSLITRLLFCNYMPHPERKYFV